MKNLSNREKTGGEIPKFRVQHMPHPSPHQLDHELRNMQSNISYRGGLFFRYKLCNKTSNLRNSDDHNTNPSFPVPNKHLLYNLLHDFFLTATFFFFVCVLLLWVAASADVAFKNCELLFYPIKMQSSDLEYLNKASFRLSLQ